MLHQDRLLPADPGTRAIARTLYNAIRDLPLICPHGHTEPAWFLPGFRFEEAADLLIVPDHYLLRMLVSQGMTFEDLGLPDADGHRADGAEVFRRFAAHYHLFRGTPSRMWLDHALHEVLKIDEPLNAASADRIREAINAKLAEPEFAPRALLKRFNIPVLSTTDAATDDLATHKVLAADPPDGSRIIPTFRPDAVTDPDAVGFGENLARLADMTGEDTTHWPGYLAALRARRAAFRALGATATDHGVPTPRTCNLPEADCQRLLDAALAGTANAQEAERFRGQMLFEMAKMSAEDGMVMQIHAGSRRNYAPSVFAAHGADKGFDIPRRTDWAEGLKPLLDELGFVPGLSIILYTLDPSAYGRELAPLAGAFPVLKLGAPWWFFDSPAGMRRHFDEVVETAGYYNLAGFVDDTRALLSIPARHDMYRRIVAGHLAALVAEHQMHEEEAGELAADLAVNFITRACRLDR